MPRKAARVASSGVPGGATFGVSDDAPTGRRPVVAFRGERPWRWVCTIALALLIGFIVFWPAPQDAGSGEGLRAWLDAWHAGGGPAWIDYDLIEFVANIVMFIPVGVVAWWWAPSIPRAVLFGLGASCLIESVQGLFLPERVADWRDLVANTSGAVFGAVLAHVVVRRRFPRLAALRSRKGAVR